MNISASVFILLCAASSIHTQACDFETASSALIDPRDLTQHPLPGQVTSALPGQLIAALPGQVVGALPGQLIGALPGQIVQCRSIIRPVPYTGTIKKSR